MIVQPLLNYLSLERVAAALCLALGVLVCFICHRGLSTFVSCLNVLSIHFRIVDIRIQSL